MFKWRATFFKVFSPLNQHYDKHLYLLIVINVCSIKAYVFVCNFYIKGILYLRSLFLVMYVYEAKDKTFAFRKWMCVKSFVFWTRIQGVFYIVNRDYFGRLLNLPQFNKTRSFMRVLNHFLFKFWHVKPVD